ncbi:bifunctional riboflavin kinase/FAD synthetase [Methylocella sp.]|uniref:bifunctional riboflavin kinase/FAD synthetase n=1 Tax=Methylocella sp. TaxID=1978226 RepID=UPI0037841598
MSGQNPRAPFVLAIDPQSPDPGLARPVVAIGNFDGVHRGHVAVIRRAEALALELDRPCAVLTFEPHPAEFFRGRHALFRLGSMDSKAREIERLGVDGMIVVAFNETLAALDAEAFVADVLIRRLDVSGVVVGYDFRFGAGRAGTPQTLRREGERRGFRVDVVERIDADEGGACVPASSTATRTALEAGDVAEAARLLGRPYSIAAEVLPGQKIGRTIGFPTANLAPGPSFRLREGVYAVRVEIDGVLRDGVANYGRRPTVGESAPLLEIHVFDFDGDLYGARVEVFFVGWLRGERKFPSLDALRAQIAEDAETARARLRGAA